jgi:replicative DNA helicase
MSNHDRGLAPHQQENLITLLAYSDEHGKVIVGLIEPTLFEGDYREFAVRIIDYWRKYKRAPKLHTSDLFADILQDDRNPRKAAGFRRLLLGFAEANVRGVSTDYVLNQLYEFTTTQQIKAAALRMYEVLARPDAAENRDAVFKAADDIKRAQMTQFGRGLRLDDDLDPFLAYLETHRGEFKTGIEPLDNAFVVPARGELMLLIGGKGRGKSWFLIHIAKQALLAGKKVLHVSLENSAMETRTRYYQALFAASTRDAEQRIQVNRMVFDDQHQLVDWEPEEIQPEFDMDDDNVRYHLETRISKWDGRIHNLVIERFPNRRLTVEGLGSFIDRLEQIDRFVPDLLLLDYAKLMKLSGNDPSKRYLSLSENLEDLRALAIERNIALVTVDQLNRGGYDKQIAHSTNVGGSWDEVATADTVITHSATEAETNCGLCRLFVDHARSEQDKFGVIVSQSLTTGQFCLEAARIPRDYFQRLMPQPQRTVAAVGPQPPQDDYEDEEDQEGQ